MARSISVRAAALGEFRRIRRQPGPILGVMAANAVVMVAAWVWLPPFASSWVFEAHGPLAFPLILELWILADVPATNVLGASPALAVALLDDPGGMTRWLVGRSLVLASLAVPPCIASAVVIGLRAHSGFELVLACGLLAVLPFGLLFAAAWLGVLFPYHPRTLRWRWAHRDRRWTQLRWLALLVIPYSWVPAIGSALVAPGLYLSSEVYRQRPSRLSETEFAVAAGLVALAVVGAVVLGLAGVRGLVAWRRAALRAYLSDPERG